MFLTRLNQWSKELLEWLIKIQIKIVFVDGYLFDVKTLVVLCCVVLNIAEINSLFYFFIFAMQLSFIRIYVLKFTFKIIISLELWNGTKNQKKSRNNLNGEFTDDRLFY